MRSDTRVMPTFPEIISIHRRSLGLSMAQYGKRYGVTRQSVWKWEAGAVSISQAALGEAVRSWYGTETEDHGGK